MLWVAGKFAIWGFRLCGVCLAARGTDPSAQKTKRVDEFLAEHAKVHPHFTPTYSLWLNQVKLWFAKIRARRHRTRRLHLCARNFKRKTHCGTSSGYNKEPKPVKWKYVDASSNRYSPLEPRQAQTNRRQTRRAGPTSRSAFRLACGATRQRDGFRCPEASLELVRARIKVARPPYAREV